jgi:glycosyltransferase involved in cell wall biosynthesis
MSISQSPLQEDVWPGAPIEAMAAGLPMVVTDWDGSRDTVRRGEDGILVPTLMAPSGEGPGGFTPSSHIEYMGTWLSLTARLTVVDIGVAAEAFRALVADPCYRARLGSLELIDELNRRGGEGAAGAYGSQRDAAQGGGSALAIAGGAGGGSEYWIGFDMRGMARQRKETKAVT